MAIFNKSTKEPVVYWQPEARAALKRVPALVRPLARNKIQERVLADGRDLVTLEDFQQAEARFKSVMGNKSEAELNSLMPTDNKSHSIDFTCFHIVPLNSLQ